MDETVGRLCSLVALKLKLPRPGCYSLRPLPYNIPNWSQIDSKIVSFQFTSSSCFSFHHLIFLELHAIFFDHILDEFKFNQHSLFARHYGNTEGERKK